METVGACLNCIAVCHAGHRIDPTLRRGRFFCDCGANHCKLSAGGVVGIAPIRPLDPPPTGSFSLDSPVVSRQRHFPLMMNLEPDGPFRCYSATNELEAKSG